MQVKRLFDSATVLTAAGLMLLVGLCVMLSGCSEEEQSSINCIKVELTVTVSSTGNFELILPIPSEFSGYKIGKDHPINDSDTPVYHTASLLKNITFSGIYSDLEFIQLDKVSSIKDAITGEAISQSATYLWFMRIKFTNSFSFHYLMNMTGDRETDWEMSDWIYTDYNGSATIAYGFHDWTDNNGHAQWLSMGWGDKQTLVPGWHRYQFAGVAMLN